MQKQQYFRVAAILAVFVSFQFAAVFPSERKRLKPRAGNERRRHQTRQSRKCQGLFNIRLSIRVSEKMVVRHIIFIINWFASDEINRRFI